MAKDRYGCATHRIKGTCSNTTTILRQRIEARVLRGLKDHLLAPELDSSKNLAPVTADLIPSSCG